MGEVVKINITSKNSTNSLSSIVTTAVNMATDVAVKSINKKISSEIEEWIDDYQTQNTTTNLKQQTIKEAFTTLQNSIAVNAYDAKNGEWATINERNVQYWTDNPLRFTRHEETGTYLIEQQDENGNWIAMGYTNQNTVLNYLKKIELLQSPESDLNKPPNLRDQKNEAQQELKSLQTQLENVMAEIYEIEGRMVETGEAIIQAEEDLEEAEKKEVEQYDAMKCRIVAMYENGDYSMLSMIFESGSIADMLITAENVKALHEYDREQLQEYVHTKEKIVALKDTLISEQEELKSLHAQAKSKRDNLSSMVEEQKDKVADDTEIMEKSENGDVTEKVESYKTRKIMEES